MIEALKELQKRYEQCDLKGHLKPNQETNLCNYCYRHLDYGTLLIGNAIIEDEINEVESNDFCTGLGIIIKELTRKI